MPPITIPALLSLSAAQKITFLERRELDVVDSIRTVYQRLFPDFREELERHFLRYYYKPIKGPDGTSQEATWDLPVSVRIDTLGLLQNSFGSLTEAAEDVLQTVLTQDILDSFEEGYLSSMWELYQAGIDVSVLPFDSDVALAAILVGVAGVSYVDRLNNWSQTYKDKMRVWMKSSVKGASTLQNTLLGVDTITTSLMNRVVGLGRSEVRRGFLLASDLVYQEHKDLLEGEVWVTKDDPLVCPICRGKHLTLTKDLPMVDSHPACRCWKVPIPLDYQGRPIDYVAFLQTIGRR